MCSSSDAAGSSCHTSRRSDSETHPFHAMLYDLQGLAVIPTNAVSTPGSSAATSWCPLHHNLRRAAVRKPRPTRRLVPLSIAPVLAGVSVVAECQILSNHLDYRIFQLYSVSTMAHARSSLLQLSSGHGKQWLSYTQQQGHNSDGVADDHGAEDLFGLLLSRMGCSSNCLSRGRRPYRHGIKRWFKQAISLVPSGH